MNDWGNNSEILTAITSAFTLLLTAVVGYTAYIIAMRQSHQDKRAALEKIYSLYFSTMLAINDEGKFSRTATGNIITTIALAKIHNEEKIEQELRNLLKAIQEAKKLIKDGNFRTVYKEAGFSDRAKGINVLFQNRLKEIS